MVFFVEEAIIAGWADGFVFDFARAVINENVWAVCDELVVEEATVKCGFVAAAADGFELFDFVCDLK